MRFLSCFCVEEEKIEHEYILSWDQGIEILHFSIHISEASPIRPRVLLSVDFCNYFHSPFHLVTGEVAQFHIYLRHRNSQNSLQTLTLIPN